MFLDIERERFCNIIITCNDVELLTRLTFWFEEGVVDPNVNKIESKQNITTKNGD